MKRIFVAMLAACICVYAMRAVADEQNDGSSDESFSFALLGDTPYSATQIDELERVIDSVNDQDDLKFVLHTGDIKGSGLCTEAVFRSRFDQYQKFDAPFIFTPGDNEWADCHMNNFGNSDPLIALSTLRNVFFPNPNFSTGGRKMRVFPQSSDPQYPEFVENVIWTRQNIVFGTIHVVGSNNDLNPWTGFDSSDTVQTPNANRIDEFNRRMAANLAWLDKIFAIASKAKSPAVFIMIQANPGFGRKANNVPNPGYQDFIDHLRDNTIAFGKRVVLAHGDSHFPLIDSPVLADVLGSDHRRRLVTLTRVMTYGWPDSHWVKVNVDKESPSIFSFELMVLESNLPNFR